MTTTQITKRLILDIALPGDNISEILDWYHGGDDEQPLMKHFFEMFMLKFSKYNQREEALRRISSYGGFEIKCATCSSNTALGKFTSLEGTALVFCLYGHRVTLQALPKNFIYVRPMLSNPFTL